MNTLNLIFDTTISFLVLVAIILIAIDLHTNQRHSRRIHRLERRVFDEDAIGRKDEQ